MTTSAPKPGERVADVRFDDDTMSVDLADGRTIIVPLAWYPRLLDATPVPARGGVARWLTALGLLSAIRHRALGQARAASAS